MPGRVHSDRAGRLPESLERQLEQPGEGLEAGRDPPMIASISENP